VKGDELESWKADLGQWINALDIEEDDVPLVWDLFIIELKEQARRNKSNAAQQQLTNLRMEEGQLKAYINKFEELAEQIGLAQADPTTTHTFISGLTVSLQDRINSQPIYGYRVARARAIQEDQKQYTVLEALRTRQQQRQRLIDRIRKRHEPVQDEEPSIKLPTAPVQRLSAIDHDHSDQPKDQMTTVPNEAPVEKQRPVTKAIRMKRDRPMSAEYPSQPENNPTIVNRNEPVVKRQRMTEHFPIEERVAEEQEKHDTIPREEPRPMK
jgi:DNA repair exonuclease SbcCD ATPase subunit